MVNTIDSKPLFMLLQYEGNMIGRLRNIVGDLVVYQEMSDVDEVIKTVAAHHERPALVAILANSLHMDDVAKINEFTRNENGLPIPIIAFSYEFDSDTACRLLDNGVADYYGFDAINEPDKRRLRNYIKNYNFIKRKEASEEERDELTGALNYNGLKRHFEALVNNMPNEVLVVVYADISNFKYFNYMFSYEEGNSLLRFWCDTITRHMSSKDLVCRMSADHFVMVMTTGQDDSTGGRDFKTILDEVRAHFAKDFSDFTIDITTGVYIYNPALERGETLDEIIGYARHAQSVIKSHGGSGMKLFDDEVWEREKRYLEINGHLRNAIDNGEIFLYLQPQYHTVTGELIGAECLCRWNHSVYGMLPTEEIIRALEKTGSVAWLDTFVW
ncbi:MAG: diguanylate cyclase, partial [Lachnospiraceae bacterium]|nr:diguanylate cyclase [Lachnospiraceae bacterium]